MWKPSLFIRTRFPKMLLWRGAQSAAQRSLATRFRTMSSSALFKGVQLVNAKGDTKDGEEALGGKVLALYFAADWCPDCRNFQPTLNSFYKDVNKNGSEFEFVFVGSDNTEADQVAHFKDKQGAWWMIPYDNKLRDELKRKYGVCAGKEKEAVGVVDRKGGIPSLVVIQPNGDLIDLHGADKVEKEGVKAFDAWKKVFTA